MEIVGMRKKDGKKPTFGETYEIAREIEGMLWRIGFLSEVCAENSTKIRISNVRIRKDVWGYNISPYTGRRGVYLGYYQWGLVNHLVNCVLDKHGLSANVRSLKGLFVIREGFEKYGFKEWQHLEGDNVGSYFNPIMRIEAWQPEDWERFEECFIKAAAVLADYYPENKAYIGEMLFYVTGKTLTQVLTV